MATNHLADARAQVEKGAQVEEPSKTEPGEFLVFSQQTGHKSSVVAGKPAEEP
jgi:hypothetical protein